MIKHKKALYLIVVIALATISGIVVFYNLVETPLSPTLTIDSINITPGLDQASIQIPQYLYSNYNFSYTININVTLNLKVAIQTTTAGPNDCSLETKIISSSWYLFPSGGISCFPAISQLVNSGSYKIPLVVEIMSNTSTPEFPSTISIKVFSNDFKASSNLHSLTLTSHGIQYMYIRDFTVNSTKPSANGLFSVYVNASFYYLSDHAVTISNCSNFTLKVNNTSVNNVLVSSSSTSANGWNFKTLSCFPSNNVTLGPGGALFNISAELVNSGGSTSYNVNYTPNPIPFQITYNSTVLSNIDTINW